MSAPAPPLDALLTPFATPLAPRLRWLVQLRWAALLAVVLGLVAARLLRLPFVAPRPIIAAVLVGALYNLGFRLRVRRLQPPEAEDGAPPLARELSLHAVADAGALTLLLAACGGLRNPIVMFYGFHVVLGAGLGQARGALIAALASLAGVALLWVLEAQGLLLSPVLLQPPLWLCAGAAALTIFSLGGFALSALRFWEREQGRALLHYQLLLRGLDALHAGLELVGADDRLVHQNRRAAAIHPCPRGRWREPEGRGAPSSSSDGAGGRWLLRGPSPPQGPEGPAEIVEVLPLAAEPQGPLRAYLYIDRTELMVNEQRAMMLERLASLGRVMQQVAHELNTPLCTIQTLAVDLSHALPERATDERESIHLIVDEARRCRAITHDLLATAHADGIGRGARRAQVALLQVVQRALRLVYGGQGGGAVLRGDESLRCVTDGDRLLQILVNLLHNARDASPEAVEVELCEEPGRVRISVRDHGPGLPEEVRERLFAPFVTTKPPGKGTGLGLYTCWLLARQLDAELTLEDDPEGGAKAVLRLPA